MDLEIKNKLCTECRNEFAEMPMGFGELSSSSGHLPHSSEGLHDESSSPDSDCDYPHEASEPEPGPSKSLTDVFISPDDELSVLYQMLVICGESCVIKRKGNMKINYVAKKA